MFTLCEQRYPLADRRGSPPKMTMLHLRQRVTTTLQHILGSVSSTMLHIITPPTPSTPPCDVQMCATAPTCRSSRSSVFWRSSCPCTGCGLTRSTATTTMTGCTPRWSRPTPSSNWPPSRSKRLSNTSVSLGLESEQDWHESILIQPVGLQLYSRATARTSKALSLCGLKPSGSW